MIVEMPLQVNGYDIDVMGIVSNIVYIRWFEDLRFKFLDTYFPFEKIISHNQSPILATTEASYKYPLTIYDKPFGRVWVIGMSRAKWKMEFEIVTENKIHCTGRQSGYFFDLNKNKPIAIPSELINRFKLESEI